MPSLREEDRELLLSQYLDGELDAETAAAVAEKLQQDETWRMEYHHMQRDDGHVAGVVQRYQRSDRFVNAVLGKLPAKKKSVQQTPAAKPGRPAHRISRRHGPGLIRRAFSFTARAAALVLFGISGLYGWNYYSAHYAPSRNTANNTVARVDGADAPNTKAAAAANTVTEDVRVIQCSDGTRIFARKGSSVDVLSARSVKLTGDALFVVAKNPQPFVVVTGVNSTAEALGTRFDVSTTATGARVRVAEGHVRVRDAAQKKTVDAFGGTEIAPDLSARRFDPRDVIAAWLHTSPDKNAGQIVPPWPQAGGSAGHHGVTPLNGPVSLVARPELFFAYPDEAERVTSAVVSADGTISLVRKVKGGESAGLLQLRPVKARYEWKKCPAVGDTLLIAPILTPQGNVITANQYGSVESYDSRTDKAECLVIFEGLLTAEGMTSPLMNLNTLADGTILLSTADNLSTLVPQSGHVEWSVKQPGLVHATVFANGSICALNENADGNTEAVLIDANGKQLARLNCGEKTTPTASATADNGMWLVSESGKLRLLTARNATLSIEQLALSSDTVPLGSGIVASGSQILRTDGTVIAKPPATGKVVAMAQDGRGAVFVAYPKGVLRLTPHNGTLKEAEFANIADGEIIKDGLAIGAGKLIVTTTRGIQIFE
jgi:hypothetical protein